MASILPFAIFAGLSAMSSVQGAFAARKAGKAQRRAAEYTAQVMGRRALAFEQLAGQQRAASQRAMIDTRRQGDAVSSRALAVMGHSGTATDPNIIGDIEDINEYNVLLQRYQGEQAGRNLEYNAALTRAGAEGVRHQGDMANFLSRAQAGQKIMSGIGNIAGAAFKSGVFDPGPPVPTTVKSPYGGEYPIRGMDPFEIPSLMNSPAPLYGKYGAEEMDELRTTWGYE